MVVWFTSLFEFFGAIGAYFSGVSEAISRAAMVTQRVSEVALPFSKAIRFASSELALLFSKAVRFTSSEAPCSEVAVQPTSSKATVSSEVAIQPTFSTHSAISVILLLFALSLSPSSLQLFLPLFSVVLLLATKPPSILPI